MAHTPSIWGVSARRHAAVRILAHITAHTPSIRGVSARHEAISSFFIEDNSSSSKILYHHVDLGEITTIDYIERESTPHNPPPRFLCLELLHLSAWQLHLHQLSLVSSPFIGNRLLSQAFAPPQLGASTTTHVSIVACIGKVFVCCLYRKHKRLPVVHPSHNLCSELHLGTLLLLAPVVSLQYLVRFYGYSCIFSMCPCAISVLNISPYSLLLCLTAAHHVTTPTKSK